MIIQSSLDLIKLRIGDTVNRTDDPRHFGRVEAIHPTMVVTIKWENGWKEIIDYRELERS
jgi:hypothetical protein